MKFTTYANGTGSSLQGYITTTYDRLTRVFGQPVGGDKTTAEWAIQFKDGTVATIYDWKEFSTPVGQYRWHIGGQNNRAVELVTATLNEDRLVDVDEMFQNVVWLTAGAK